MISDHSFATILELSTGELNLTGELLVDVILGLASLLRSKSAPGVVSIVLLAIFLALAFWHLFSSLRFLFAVKRVRSFFPASSGEKITKDKLIDIDQGFATSRERKGFHVQLDQAWSEFKETTVFQNDESQVVRNTVRPSNFFNLLDLGVDGGWWRQVPALFISVGLFLTFLGLVAALDQTGQVLNSSSVDSGNTVSGLTTLLQVASAKFIMSLTGLFCAILFTLEMKWLEKQKDGALHKLCSTIEKGYDFLSEQDILREMRDIAKEQNDQLKTFSTELVAQVARPLKEDLPEAIRNAIELAMAPAMEGFSRDAGRSIESMTGTVSEQITGGVQSAVEEMSKTVGVASNTFESIAERLNHSSAEVTRNFSVASDTMVSDITAATSSMRESLQEPLTELINRVQTLTKSVEAAAGEVGVYSESINSSAISVTSTNEALDKSTQSLINATMPVKDALSKIQDATENMSNRIENASTAVANSARATTGATVRAIEGMRDSVFQSQDAINQGYSSLHSAITEFKDILARYEEIDGSLGTAFQRIEDEVKRSIDSMSEYQTHLSQDLAGALQKLEAVIAQAEPFVPKERVSN